MERVTGRTDDMLIIRGVNFFPSQIESIIMKRWGVSSHYMVVVDRPGAMDEVEVKIEVNDEFMKKAAADVLAGASRTSWATWRPRGRRGRTFCATSRISSGSP
jgi:phenylacetate-CoA ligase